VDAVPQLFRQWDTDSDGMMRRYVRNVKPHPWTVHLDLPSNALVPSKVGVSEYFAESHLTLAENGHFNERLRTDVQFINGEVGQSTID
jgi:hypothetical protein